MLRIILVAIAAAVFIVLIRRNKTRSLRAFTAYYAQKRRDFPWLENWIKENGDPVLERVKGDKGTSITLMIMCFVVVVLVMLIFPKWIPLHIILLAGGIFITELVARDHAKNPGSLSGNESDDDIEYGGEEIGLTLECPSCHCPHSYVMPQKERIVDGDSGSRTTTTTTRETSGGGLVGLSEGILHDGTSTKVTETHNYYGRDIKDFKCLNCGHTERNEYNWSSGNPTDVGINTYNPPVPAWSNEKMKAKQTSAANDLYEQAKREEAQKVSAPAPLAQGTQAANANTGIPPTLLKAAESGNKDAKWEVGIKYLLGLGVAKDEEKAKKWIREAEDQDIDFDFSDVLYYRAEDEKGKGNYVIAVPLYERVIEESESGHGTDYSNSAYWALAGIYDDKNSGMYDKEKARYWYQKSADDGDRDAKKILKDL